MVTDALLRLWVTTSRSDPLERVHADENTERTKNSIVLSRLLERPDAI